VSSCAQPPTPRITIILASDLPIARAALRSWLCAQPTIKVATEVGLDNALEHIRKYRPQVVVLHFGESNAAALKLTQRIRKEIPSTAIVVVTYSAEQAYVRSMLMAGATGYVLLHGDPDDLLTAIWKASRGSSYLDPLLSDELIQMLAQRPTRPRDNSTMLCFLSEREEQVLKHIAFGHTHKEIADLLSLSEKTVDRYRARILEKTNLRTRAEIVHYAIALGMFSALTD
jgi:two-component system, NarL family, response regulator NreC